jgi:hypothetical protein
MQNKVVKSITNVHGNVSQTKVRIKLIFYTPECVNFCNYLTTIHMSTTIVFNLEPPHARNTISKKKNKSIEI